MRSILVLVGRLCHGVCKLCFSKRAGFVLVVWACGIQIEQRLCAGTCSDCAVGRGCLWAIDLSVRQLCYDPSQSNGFISFIRPPPPLYFQISGLLLICHLWMWHCSEQPGNKKPSPAWISLWNKRWEVRFCFFFFYIVANMRHESANVCLWKGFSCQTWIPSGMLPLTYLHWHSPHEEDAMWGLDASPQRLGGKFWHQEWRHCIFIFLPVGPLSNRDAWSRSDWVEFNWTF